VVVVDARVIAGWTVFAVAAWAPPPRVTADRARTVRVAVDTPIVRARVRRAPGVLPGAFRERVNPILDMGKSFAALVNR
jgi:hypothetical protein